MTDRMLYYWLAREGHTGKEKHDLLTDIYGSLAEAYKAVKKGDFVITRGLTENYYRRLSAAADEKEISLEMKRMKSTGIRMTCLSDEDYPEKLLHIYSAPVALFYKGRLPERKKPLIAIVGARACTERGRFLATRTGEELAEAGVGVISGLALGTDAAAHKGALRVKDGYTCAILGCGPDICYPLTNFELYSDMSRKGGVISEFIPGTAPLRNNFPQRNRIISGLSDGILVTEARVKSGSLITADMGLDQGKNIYALPGDPDSVMNAGTNRLIQLGAKLVRKTDDILEDLHIGFVSSFQRMPLSEQVLESSEKIVYDTLCLVPRHITEIMRESGMSQNELFPVLLSLEMKGFAERTSFEYYIAAPDTWRGPV